MMEKGKKIRYRRYISKQGLTFLLSGERQFARVAKTVMIMFIMLLTLPAFASSPEVIPYSGALRIERSDIVFEGSHPPLEFSRYFNSNSLVPGSMGMGWSHNYQYHLVIKDNKKEIFVLEPGNSINIFRQVKGGNTYYSTSGRGRFFRSRDGLKLILPQKDELYFDSTGKLTEFRNSYRQAIKFTYTNGRLTRVSGSFGQFIEFSYNKYGRVILASSSKEDRIEYSYDAKGHLSGIKKNGEALERYLVDTKGNITDFHLINKDLSWKFTYNRSGQIKTFTNPFQYVLRYEYEQTPEFTAFHLISPDGGKTTHKHFLDNSKNVVIDPEGGKKITEFDPETGLLKKIIDPNQNVTEYRWDEQKRLVELIDPMGGQTKIEYLKDISFPVKLHTPDRNVIKMTYDSFYNLIKVDSKNHGTQVFKYDKEGRQVYKKDYNGSVMKFEYLSGWLPTSISDEAEKLVELEYDKNGQLSYFKWSGSEKKSSFNEMIHKAEKELGLTQKPVDLSDAGKILLSHDRLSEYTFDKTANITMIKFPGGSIRKLEYDLNGQLKKVIQDDKVFETVQYDPAGNVISKSYGDDKEARFTYDPFNRLIKAVHPDDSIIAYSYSHSGNVATSRYNHVSMQFSHNKQDLIETIRLTAGKGTLGDVQYSYNKKGRLTGISALEHDLALKRDSNGLISVIDSPAFGQMSFEYNASGKIKKVKYPNGVVTDYNMFDPQNQSIEIKNPLGTLLNINIKKDLKGLTIERGTRSGIEEFKYDARSQLILAKYGPKSFHYSYDLWGNRITEKTEGKNTFSSYAPEGKILTRADTLYSWDTRGNLISRKNKSEETKFVYDFNNRLINIYGHGGKSVSYHYDAGGKLVSRTANGETAYYLYTGQNPIVEVSSNGNVIRKYLYGPEIDQIFGMEEKGHKYYFHRDERNNVVLITDEKGAEVVSYKYDPFGNLIEKKGDFESPFLFSGLRYEPLFNLYYMRARFFDPEIGRFISRDPLPGNLDNALSTNPYIYVGNNPMNHTDPLGLEKKKDKPPSTFLGQAWSSVTGFGNAVTDTSVTAIQEVLETGSNVILPIKGVGNITVTRTYPGAEKLSKVFGTYYSGIKAYVAVKKIIESDAPRNEKLNAALGWLGGKAFDALAAEGAAMVAVSGLAALPLAAITSWTQGQVTDLIQETLNLKDAFKDEDAAKARAREALNTLLPDVFKAQVERAIAEGNFVEATRIAEQMQDYGEGIGHMGVQADAIDLFDTAIKAERAHADKCPNDPNKTEPGICGCDASDIDTDKDGTPDCNDKCPNDPNRTEQCIASVEEQRETLVRNKDCSMYKNTFAKWDDSAKQPRCFCKPGFTFKYKQGCIPKSGGVISTKRDTECSSYISLIKGTLQTGDKNVLKLLASKAKSMGCSDPAIDQVLNTGGVVTGGGGDDLSGCKNIGYIDIEFQGKRIKQAVCNDDPGDGVTGDRGNTGSGCSAEELKRKWESVVAAPKEAKMKLFAEYDAFARSCSKFFFR